VGEPAVRAGEGAVLLGVAVPHPHLRDGRGDLLAVRTDVLDGGRARGTRDSGETLDAGPALRDGMGDARVPGFTGGEPHVHATAAVVGLDVDAAGGHVEDLAGK